MAGSWSNYHQMWSQAIPILNGRLIRIRYEDVVANPLKACDQISATIGLGYNPDNKIPSFEELHKKDPHHFRAGKATGWEENYTDNQIQLLEKLHSETMQELGYEISKPLKSRLEISNLCITLKSRIDYLLAIAVPLTLITPFPLSLVFEFF